MAGSRASCRALGDVKDDRHRPEGLGKAAGTGRLLADRAVARWEGLVEIAGGLAADPELDEDEVGAVEGGIGVRREDETAGPVQPVQHSPREPSDDLDPIGIRVQQDQLVNGHAIVAESEALDQFRGVRAAAADNRDPDAHRPSIDPVIYVELIAPS